MSIVHKSLRSSEQTPTKWFLRASNGVQYGPVDIAALSHWAAEGRIGPDDSVSTNRSDWKPARNLPELKMDWEARLRDGRTYGPFNVLAVPSFHQKGVLPGDAELVNLVTGNKMLVRELLKVPAGPGTAPAVSDEAEASRWKKICEQERAEHAAAEAELRRELDEALKRCAAADEKLEQAEEQASEITRLRGELEQAGARLAEAERAAEGWRAAKAKAAGLAAEAERLIKRISQGDEQEVRLKAELEEARGRVAQAERLREELAEREAALRRAEQARAAALNESVLLKEEATRLREELEAERAGLDQRDKERAAEVERLRVEKEEAQARMAEADRAAHAAEEEADGLRKELALAREEIGRLEEARKRAEEERVEQEAAVAGELDALRSARREIEQALAAAEQKVSAAAREAESQQAEMEKLRSTYTARFQDMSQRLRAQTARLLQLRNENADLEKALTEAQQKQQAEKPQAQQAAPPEIPVARRISPAWAAALLIFGVAAGFVGGWSIGSKRPDTWQASRIAFEPPAKAAAEPDIPSASEPLSKRLGAESALAAVSAETGTAWPLVNVQGIVTFTNEPWCSIVFEEGLFTHMTNLSAAAERTLSAVAERLTVRIRDYTLVVRGHTDNAALAPTAAYKDNYELGLARARAVADFLVARCGLPADCITVASAGTNDPPYSNDDESSRLRNRTAVLHLTRRARPAAD